MSEFKKGDVVRTKGYPSFDWVVTKDADENGVGCERFYVEPVGNSGFGGRIGCQFMRIDPLCLELVPLLQDEKRPCDDCPAYADENAGPPDATLVGAEELFDILADQLRDDGYDVLAKDIEALGNTHAKLVRENADDA